MLMLNFCELLVRLFVIVNGATDEKRRSRDLRPFHGVFEYRPLGCGGGSPRPAENKTKEQLVRNFKGTFVLVVIAILFVAGSALAGDWQKLGRKTVVFGNTEDTSSISTNGVAVSQIAFKISGDWVRLTEVTLHFDDGSTQTIENFQSPRPSMTSDGIAIDGGPKTINSIDFSFRAASSSKQGRASVIALGQ